MTAKENNSGLLSKVAQFVRHPATDWSDLEKFARAPEPEDIYTKQALKDMIERKRKNDFVRRREFDHLRKLRSHQPLSNPELADRSSSFQASMGANLDERASTLKKIDEIEAQMSKQWWKGRKDEASAPGRHGPLTGPPSTVIDIISSRLPKPPGAGASGFEPTQMFDLGSGSGSSHPADDISTRMGLTGPADYATTNASLPWHTSPYAERKNFEAGVSGFSSFKLFADEAGDSFADPDMEEAAIRFANGDDAGAEAGLLAALQLDHVLPDLACKWAEALFDLYRATRQQAPFERLVLDYAARFGRAAPAWHGSAQTPRLDGVVQAWPVGSAAGWVCPAVLDVMTVHSLAARLLHEAAPWRLNWTRLQTITPEAAAALAQLFAVWCLQDVELHFESAQVLEKTLLAATPSGNKKVSLLWWGLRLDALRVMRLQDEFELAALDFCVTFEVSPPAWVNARCVYVSDELGDKTSPDLAQTVHSDAPGMSQDDPSLAETRPMAMEMDARSEVVLALTGEMLGDIAETLKKFEANCLMTNSLVISCANLIRVDFSAAGSLLNWVTARELEGCRVQFREVPRLVAAFFSVIGINEHASVMLRAD